ncbi:MAG: DNA gyrase subunit A [Saprospiraceae bacterium]|nr:DNA gyrase subunit A [Saprospiraceae bacterium]
MSVNQRIVPIAIEDEMKSAYIDYSMSVIVARALPDVRDGLKPVHRRVLYGMHELGVGYNKAHKKSARIVGEVLGKYHPHGDSSVYDTMVRMAQDWSLRYPLVDGQGNFGSMDGDSPAAMRYTEARLARISDEILSDINKNTVDFTNNFDDSLEEPTVLPTSFPNLLVNGTSGIAVGMATNMMPHNLSDAIDAICASIDNPEISIDELIKIIKAPDFPTGGIIYGLREVREAYHTGKGRVVIRGRAEVVTTSTKEQIIITEIPYQVNKANLVMKIAELINEKRLTGISDIRDESDRNGVRVVVDIKRDAIASVVLNNLYKFTPLQTSYGINNIALVKGRPRQLTIKQIIDEFIKFRVEVLVRRTQFELNKAQERAHILEGLLVALDDLDEVIELIRRSSTPEDAKEALMKKPFNPTDSLVMKMMEIESKSTYFLSEAQAKAILEMRLQRLTGLERDKIRNEYEELLKTIAHLNSILGSTQLQFDIIKTELLALKEKFGDKRRTEIALEDGEISIEEMIPQEDMVITISHLGYIKRTKVTEYRTQSRGGRGAMGAKTRNEDFVEHMFIANTHQTLLLFTDTGKCYWMKVYEIPEAAKNAGGRAIQNLLSIPKENKVRAYIIIQNLSDEEFIKNNYIVFCTKQGQVKKSLVEDFSRPRQGGIIAITINENDELLEARLTNGSNEILIANRVGRAIRFPEEKVRPMGRTAAGVRGITLDEDSDDRVVGMICVDPNDKETTILVVSENGNGKRSELEDYRITNRGGKGVRTLNVTEKTGSLVAIKAVKEKDDLMITNVSGLTIRVPVTDLRVSGRATQGVKVIRIQEEDRIADVAIVQQEEVEEDIVVVDDSTAGTIATAEETTNVEE